MKRCMNFNNLKDMAMTRIGKVTETEEVGEIKPVMTPEQARRVQEILESNGEAVTPLRALSATCAVERLNTAWEREQLRREKKGEIER